MSERRYNEAEVDAIFERAAKARQTGGQRRLTSGTGMTLAELQEIGREVGISAGDISEAAAVVTTSGLPTERTLMGFPLGVGRTIELNRKLTEDEWERLVVDLRETFDARGRLRADGSLRQWTNGNLQALLEPTATGHRVRLKTLKGQSLRLMIGGAIAFVFGTATLIATALGNPAQNISDLIIGALIVSGGVGMFGLGLALLPGWARTRIRQMEDVAGRLALMAGSSPRQSGNEG